MRFTKRGFPSNNSVGTAGATPAFLRERFRQSIQSQYLQSCAIFLPIGHAYCGQCPPPVLDPLGAASCSPVTPPKAHSTRGQFFRRQGPHLFHLVPKHHSVHVRTNGYDFRLCCYHYYRRYQWRSNNSVPRTKNKARIGRKMRPRAFRIIDLHRNVLGGRLFRESIRSQRLQSCA